MTILVQHQTEKSCGGQPVPASQLWPYVLGLLACEGSVWLHTEGVEFAGILRRDGEGCRWL